VVLTEEDILRISEHLGMDIHAFCTTYLSYDEEDDMWFVHVKPGGACVFLRDERCSIHEVKPLQCRTYPFWPELLEDRATWEEEGALCEGIGRGIEHHPGRVNAVARGERATYDEES
jgi:uncharacterized protein